MIFAAGLGTRLRPYTDTLPKALVPLNSKTLLEHQIERLSEAGVEHLVVNVHHFAGQITDFLTAHHNFGLDICVSDESACLLETGGGLKKAKPFFAEEIKTGEPFLACNVDILSNLDIPALWQAHQAEDEATLVVSERTTQRYLVFDQQKRLHGWTNIQTHQVRPASLALPFEARSAREYQLLAFSGMQVLSPRIFEDMETLGDKFSLIDLYLRICEQAEGAKGAPKRVIRGYEPVNYRMMDVGKADQISEAEAFAKSL